VGPHLWRFCRTVSHPVQKWEGRRHAQGRTVRLWTGSGDGGIDSRIDALLSNRGEGDGSRGSDVTPRRRQPVKPIVEQLSLCK